METAQPDRETDSALRPPYSVSHPYLRTVPKELCLIDNGRLTYHSRNKRDDNISVCGGWGWEGWRILWRSLLRNY
jgi:hypothetical protein